MARANTIWERLWESTEGPTVTLKIPRALADDLLAALSAACEMGDDADGMLAIDLDGSNDDMDGGLDLDPVDDDAMDMIMRGSDDGHGSDDDDDDGDDGSDSDDDSDDDDDDDKEKDESAYCDPDSDGMRPKTALGERYVGFDRLAKKVGPGAAAEIGRKKYGKDKFQRAAAKGKKLG